MRGGSLPASRLLVQVANMTTFTTRRISQETFDAVVRENVEDFDMDAAEAVREAREQFEHQGVDLTGVDVSGSEERKAERAALVADVALVKKAAAGGVARPDLLEALARAATLCSAGRGRAAASARSTVVAAQGLSALARLARSCVDEATDAVGDAGVLAATLAALDRAVRGDADARDAFQYGGCVEATVAALKAGVKTDAAAAAAALRVAAAAARQCEAVKAAFMRLKLARLAVEALVTAAAARLADAIAALPDDRPVRLIGSSLGAYVAAVYASDAANAKKIDRMMLLAPTFKPRACLATVEKEMGVSLGDAFREDLENHPDFPFAPCRAYVVHGYDDEAAPLENSLTWVRDASVVLREGTGEVGEVAERRLLEVAGMGHGVENALPQIKSRLVDFFKLPFTVQGP